MYIDCHVHLRDEGWNHKETIEHGLRVAEDSGLDAVFDMPNNEPVTTTREQVLERLKLAREANSEVFYGLYVGLTSNTKQIREAVKIWREFFPKPGDKSGVIGLKMFAGKSVGDLSVVEFEKQFVVYQTLARAGYNGVLAVHCEKESEMRPDLWIPGEPITHGRARPEYSETASVCDQINFVKSTGFRGHLHIAHVSTSRTLPVIDYARKSGIDISCGVTPHHLLLPEDIMHGKDGILYKVNPPLRDGETVRELFNCVLDGKIDVFESDHAPHTEAEKREKYMSGIPNLASWPDVIGILKRLGVHEGLINRMAFDRVNEIFGLKIQRTERQLKSHVSEHVFNPYAHLLKS